MGEDLKELQRENKRLNRTKMWALKQYPCSDCKLRWHPEVMTFDHIDRKTVTKNKNAKNISAVTYYKPEIFTRLLKNMSVVCLNCHRIREIKRDITNPKVTIIFREESNKLLSELKQGALL